MITVPPRNSVENAIQCAVPCMNGHAGTQRVRGTRQRCAISSGRRDHGAASAARRPSRRRTRLRGATSRPWACRSCHPCRGCRGRRPNARGRRGPPARCGARPRIRAETGADRPVAPSRVRVVVSGTSHGDERSEERQRRTDRAQLRRELLVKHDRAGVAVGEQVPQLVLDVAVVDVDRDRAQLERGQHRLEVLDRVVEVDRDVVARPDALARPACARDGRRARRARRT